MTGAFALAPWALACDQAMVLNRTRSLTLDSRSGEVDFVANKQ